MEIDCPHRFENVKKPSILFPPVELGKTQCANVSLALRGLLSGGVSPLAPRVRCPQLEQAPPLTAAPSLRPPRLPRAPLGPWALLCRPHPSRPAPAMPPIRPGHAPASGVRAVGGAGSAAGGAGLRRGGVEASVHPSSSSRALPPGPQLCGPASSHDSWGSGRPQFPRGWPRWAPFAQSHALRKARVKLRSAWLPSCWPSQALERHWPY